METRTDAATGGLIYAIPWPAVQYFYESVVNYDLATTTLDLKQPVPHSAFTATAQATQAAAWLISRPRHFQKLQPAGMGSAGRHCRTPLQTAASESPA
jgi:hypothetical protein